MTLAELRSLDIGSRVGPQWKGTQIPTFEEILELCQSKIEIYLDLKDVPIPELMKILKYYNMEKEVIWYFPASFISQIDDVNKVCANSFLMPDPGPIQNISKVLSAVKICTIASDMGELSKHFVETAHSNIAMAFVDEKSGTEEEWTQILNWKTDGIQVNQSE